MDKEKRRRPASDIFYFVRFIEDDILYTCPEKRVQRTGLTKAKVMWKNGKYYEAEILSTGTCPGTLKSDWEKQKNEIKTKPQSHKGTFYLVEFENKINYTCYEDCVKHISNTEIHVKYKDGEYYPAKIIETARDEIDLQIKLYRAQAESCSVHVNEEAVQSTQPEVLQGTEVLSEYDKELNENVNLMQQAKVALGSYNAKQIAATSRIMGSGEYIAPDFTEELKIIDAATDKILGKKCKQDIEDMVASIQDGPEHSRHLLNDEKAESNDNGPEGEEENREGYSSDLGTNQKEISTVEGGSGALRLVDYDLSDESSETGNDVYLDLPVIDSMPDSAKIIDLDSAEEILGGFQNGVSVESSETWVNPEPEKDGIKELQTEEKKKKAGTHKRTICKFCNKSVTHFPRHLSTYHSLEDEVITIMEQQHRSEYWSEKIQAHKEAKAKEEKEGLTPTEPESDKEEPYEEVPLEEKKSKKKKKKRRKKKKVIVPKLLSESELTEAQENFRTLNMRVRDLTSKLRNEGAYKHNLSVPLKEEIIPLKLPNNRAYKPTRLTHAPCEKCLKTLRIDNLPGHVRNCVSVTEKTPEMDPEEAERIRRRVVITSRQLLYPHPENNESLSKEFNEKILSGMRNDLTTLVARSDELILEVGKRFFGSHRQPKHVKQVRKLIRDLANLYLAVDEIQELEQEEGKSLDCGGPVKNLTDCIDARRFPLVVAGLQALAGFEKDTGAVRVTSISGRYQQPLKTCGDVILSNSYQSTEMTEQEKKEIQEQMHRWKHTITIEWKYNIGSICELSRKANLSLKGEVIPLDSDIRKLSRMVEGMYPETIKALETNPLKKNFEALCQLIIVDAILLARRRPAEVCGASLQQYSRLIAEKEDEVTADYATDAEKRAGKALKVFYVVGKGEKIVPILVTNLMEQGIGALMKFRPHFKIPSDDTDLLFPKPFETGAVYDGSVIMAHFVRKGELTKPELLNCRSLRRHIATVAQLQRYDATATKNLATFMGHTGNIHDQHYRRPLPFVHRTQIGARLLEFRKPGLRAVTQSADSRAQETAPEADILDTTLTTEASAIASSPQTQCGRHDNEGAGFSEDPYAHGSSSEGLNEVLQPLTDTDDSSGEDHHLSPRRTKKQKRPRWSKEEVKLVMDQFGSLISKKLPVPRKQIVTFYERNKIMQKRRLNAVVTYIYQLINKA